MSGWVNPIKCATKQVKIHCCRVNKKQPLLHANVEASDSGCSILCILSCLRIIGNRSIDGQGSSAVCSPSWFSNRQHVVPSVSAYPHNQSNLHVLSWPPLPGCRSIENTGFNSSPPGSEVRVTIRLFIRHLDLLTSRLCSPPLERLAC